ncbi:InlB B-repeat-containing protein [Labilibacter marinus]|uniref:InlB B-repeat-containing protein n=1 Tax=Labilibacter marinus TaxID=1477105 RepID=UPI000833EB91|nr:T9SS type A sorting domain-containing protein [Labilibacter marinus]
MKTVNLKVGWVLCLCVLAVSSFAQSLQHPAIWTTPADKTAILAKIENYSWAASVVAKAKAAVEDKVDTHLSNPATILNTIPEFASDDNLSEAEASSANAGHSKVLNYASYASMVYYVTGEEKYAQFAADILWNYIEELETRSPHNTAMSGSDFYDPRAGYAQFSIAYDFLYNYLKESGRQVYTLSSASKVAYDHTKAQKAVYNIAMNALHEHGGADTKYGKMVSNHPILRSPGVLFSILCVDDDTERERMFDVFWNVGTKEQNSFTKTILPMFGEQGIWPEAVSYSFMQNVTLVLNIVDRLKPELNVMDDNTHILDGNFLFDNLRMPNRRFVRYGDSHRDIDKTGEIYRYTLNLSKRRGLTDYVEKAKIALRQGYDADGGYDPIVPITTFGNYRAFDQLFWGIDVPNIIEEGIDFQKPTVLVKHAGVALQRNYVEEDNEDYGLCGIIGGAHYVHSHVTGITMELYGAGYVMAANGGLPHTLAERSDPVHTTYFWRHAGNNTMIVNGTSHGIQTGAWNSDSQLWMPTTVNVAAEPKHLEDAINPNFSFATQFLDDHVNDDQQQRTLSTIRTSETTAYYFDMFRSKSLGTNNFHDYIYHNLGDEMHIFNSDEQELSVSATTRYQNDIGDTHASPGWRFFEETKVTEFVDAATKVRFDLNETNTYMTMFAPAGVAREYTKALGPGTREAKGGYEDKKTQIIAVRQQGEAWNKPYVHIFEPSKSANTSVKSVEHLYTGDVIVGAKVYSQVGDKVVTDFIICQEDASQVFALAEEGITFTGRFAVVRKEQKLDKAYVTLYIGEGTSLVYGEHSLDADNDKKGQKVIEVAADMSRVIGFKDLENNQEIAKGSDLSVEAIIGTDFTEATLFVDGVSISTLTEAPYAWSSVPELTNMNNLSYLIKIVAKDAQGEVEERSLTVLTPNQWAYTSDNKPHTIPGKVEFEHYDNGGKDIAYWDKTGTNASYIYRGDDQVDLTSSGLVSDIKTGEWLEFTIDVATSGNYDLDVRHQTTRNAEVNQLTVSLPEENTTLISNFMLGYTGSNYEVKKVGNFYLEAGTHVLKFNFLEYGFKVDYFELTKTSDAYKVTFNDGEKLINVYSGNDGTCKLPTTPTRVEELFVNWVTGTGSVFDETTVVTENMEVTATWKAKTYTISVISDHGTVSFSPELDEYDPYTQVTLTATPDTDYEFKSWSGDYTGTENPLTITVVSALNITANYRNTTSVKSQVENILKISPNPSNGTFIIKLINNEEATYNLYSLNGALISNGDFYSETKVSVETNVKGMFMLEVITKRGKEVQKLIIK